MSETLRAAQALVASLARPEQPRGASWRWATVDANNGDGTLDVIVGETAITVTASGSALGAAAGDRVRVMWQGTDAVADSLLGSTSAPDITSATTLGGTGTNQFAAIGHCATLTSAGTTPSAQWGSASVCTIPDGYRPKMGLYFPVAENGSPQSATYLVIGTDGSVTLQNAGGTQSAVGYFVTASWCY